jgi:hypothetical protein
VPESEVARRVVAKVANIAGGAAKQPAEYIKEKQWGSEAPFALSRISAPLLVKVNSLQLRQEASPDRCGSACNIGIHFCAPKHTLLVSLTSRPYLDELSTL